MIVIMSPKKKIPKALREQVWTYYNQFNYSAKCNVTWCQNILTPFNFEVGHNIPESKGGATDISNLRPICSSCNKSMGNRYTIDEFSSKFSGLPIQTVEPRKGCFIFRCFGNTKI